eukprot:6143093-Prorocentrum_lima.AAC.1
MPPEKFEPRAHIPSPPSESGVHMVVETCIMEIGDDGPVWQVKMHFPRDEAELGDPTYTRVQGQ